MPADKLTHKLQQTYARVAERYASVNAAMPASVLDAAQRFVALFDARTTILDLGCGAGRDSVWFGASGYDVMGLDLSLAMLKKAQEQHVARLVQANMCLLPLCDHGVDGIWANASMVHIPRQWIDGVLKECQRVLADDGLLFIAMQVGDGEAWEDVSYGQQAPRFFSRYQPGEFRILLEQAGFRIAYFDTQCANPQRHWMHFYAYKTT